MKNNNVKKLAKLVTLSLMAGAMLGIASGAWAEDYTDVIVTGSEVMNLDIKAVDYKNVIISNATDANHGAAICLTRAGKDLVNIFGSSVPSTPDGTVSLTGKYYGVFIAWLNDDKHTDSEVHIDGNEVSLKATNHSVGKGYTDEGYGIFAYDGGKVYVNQNNTHGNVSVEADYAGLSTGRKSDSYIAIDGDKVNIKALGTTDEKEDEYNSGYGIVSRTKVDINKKNTNGQVDIESSYIGLYADAALGQQGEISVDGSEVKVVAPYAAIYTSNGKVNINQNGGQGKVVLTSVAEEGKAGGYAIYAKNGSEVKIGGNEVDVTGGIEVINKSSVNITGGEVSITGDGAGTLWSDRTAVISAHRENRNKDEAKNGGSVSITADKLTISDESLDSARGYLVAADETTTITLNAKEIVMNANGGQDCYVAAIQAYSGGTDMGSGLDGGEVKIEGGSLKINVNAKPKKDSQKPEGLRAQNCETSPALEDSRRATIDINNDSTTINVLEGKGIYAISGGLVKIDSNLTINAERVIAARGGAKVRINTGDTTKTTVLNGNIDYEYDGETSGSTINADIQVGLKGTGSVWTGNSTISWLSLANANYKIGNEGVLYVDALNVTLSDSATWRPTLVIDEDVETSGTHNGKRQIAVNTLTMNAGIIDMTTDATANNTKAMVGTLVGESGIVKMDADNVLEVDEISNTDLTVNGGKLVYSTDAEAKVDAGEKLTLNGTTLTQKLTNNGTMNINGGKLVDVATVNDGSVTNIIGDVTAHSIASQKMGVTNINKGLETGTVNVEATVTGNGSDDDHWVMFQGLKATGSSADIKGGKMYIGGENLNVNITDNTTGEYVAIYGVHTATNTLNFSKDEEQAHTIINAKNTNVSVLNSSKAVTPGGVAFTVMSKGILDVDSNLTAKAGCVLATRGDAKTKINVAENKTVKLDGDIEFNYDEATSGTKVDASVDLRLTDKDSYWTGKIVKSSDVDQIPDGKADVSGMQLTLKNGATWNLTGDSLMNYLTVDGGNINVQGDANVTITTNDGSVSLKNATISDKVGFTLNNSTLTADSSLFLKNDYTATTKGGNLVGTSGSVNLYLTRDANNPVEYTVKDYNDAKSALLIEGTEKATLTFLNGKLKVDAGQTVVINGTQGTDDKKTVEITGNANNGTPTVVSESSVAGTGTQIAGIPTEYINITGAGNDASKTLEQALAKTSQVTIKESTFVAKGFRVAEGAEASKTEVNVTLGKGANVTLAGDKDAAAMTVDKTDTDMGTTSVQVGEVQGVANKAVFNVGLEGGEVEQQNLKIDTVNMANGTLNVQNANLSVTTLGVVGAKTDSDTTVVKDVNVTGGSLAVTKNNGVNIFVDPFYADVIGEASSYSQAGNDVNAKIIGGRNSLIVLGETDRTKAEEVFNSMEAGLKFGNAGDVNSVLYVAQAQTMGDNGGVYLDGSLTANPGDSFVTAKSFTAKAKSLTMVEAAAAGSDGAINGLTSASVDSAAKLYIANAEPEKEYIILKGTGIESGWSDGNVSVNGLIENLTVELDISGKTYFKVTTGELAFNVDDTVMPNVGTAIVAGNDVKAKEVLKAMVDVPTKEQQAANVNAYANMGENLGVTRGAYDVANMVGNAVTEHWENNAKGENIWAVYTHSKNKVDGLKLGGMDAQYDAQYNGVIVGADLSKGFGIALNYADGNVSNGFGGHNDAKYYGGSIYGRKVFGNWNLFGDVTYTHGKNELAQNGIEADAKTNTISAGLTAKYLSKAGKYSTIAPFAGVRYMHIDGKDYTDSLGVNREADKINSVIIPVGLEYTGEFKMAKSGWNWKPRLAVGYLFNLGDRENDMTMRYGGAEDVFGYDFVDKGAFFTHAGMDFEKKNFTLGISYDFMKSKNSKNNKWNVNMNYAF